MSRRSAGAVRASVAKAPTKGKHRSLAFGIVGTTAVELHRPWRQLRGIWTAGYGNWRRAVDGHRKPVGDRVRFRARHHRDRVSAYRCCVADEDAGCRFDRADHGHWTGPTRRRSTHRNTCAESRLRYAVDKSGVLAVDGYGKSLTLQSLGGRKRGDRRRRINRQRRGV